MTRGPDWAVLARLAIEIWESDPRRQAIAKALGVHPSEVSDDDVRRASQGIGAHRNPPLQQIPRKRP